MPPFSSLLSFDSRSGKVTTPPPTTHIIATSTYPAPTNFLPLHYARNFLDTKSGQEKRKVVIWIGCDGSGEAHYRSALKRCGTNVNKTNLVYIDAVEDILESPSGSSNSLDLQRLLSKIDEQLEIVSRSLEEDDIDANENESVSRILVIIDDASALAWAISDLDEEEEELGDAKVDPRVRLLRSKCKGAIQKDKVGIALARWIDDHVRERCNAVSPISILLV